MTHWESPELLSRGMSLWHQWKKTIHVKQNHNMVCWTTWWYQTLNFRQYFRSILSGFPLFITFATRSRHLLPPNPQPSNFSPSTLAGGSVSRSSSRSKPQHLGMPKKIQGQTEQILSGIQLDQKCEILLLKQEEHLKNLFRIQLMQSLGSYAVNLRARATSIPVEAKSAAEVWSPLLTLSAATPLFRVWWTRHPKLTVQLMDAFDFQHRVLCLPSAWQFECIARIQSCVWIVHTSLNGILYTSSCIAE